MHLRAPHKGAFFLARKWSDDQVGNDESGGDSRRRDQHLPAMPSWPINAGGMAGGDQSRIKFGPNCVLAGPSPARPPGARLKRKRIPKPRTAHGKMVTPTE